MEALMEALRNVTFVVIDFEALTPAGRPAEPIEVAALALDVRDGQLVESGRFSSLIQPPPDVPVTERDLTLGITEAGLREAPLPSVVLSALDQRLANPPYRLVAQHAATEAGLIHRQRDHCPRLAATPILDTIRMAKRATQGLTSFGLDELLRHFGIPKPALRHRAMPDVEVTAEVFRRLLEDGARAGIWSSLLELDMAAVLPPKPAVAAEATTQDTLFGMDDG